MMVHQIYETNNIRLLDNSMVEVSPLKLKYLIEFMDEFDKAKSSKDIIKSLVSCARIAMKQYCPRIDTDELVEDIIDVRTLYDIVYYASGIRVGHWQKNQDEEPIDLSKSEKSSWADLNLKKMIAEVFLLGSWKNYDDLMTSINMPELLLTIESKRDLDYQEKKFLAAMQGVDLDNAGGDKAEEDPWEAMKARVAAKASGIGSGDPNDILSFQGVKASQHGFGIGMGLDYSTEI